MSLLQGTSKSLAHLVKALAATGHRLRKSALAEVLHAQGFSLCANQKTIEGKAHPDRDGQFAHINGKGKQFEQKGAPIIWVDCQKKDLNTLLYFVLEIGQRLLEMCEVTKNINQRRG